MRCDSQACGRDPSSRRVGELVDTGVVELSGATGPIRVIPVAVLHSAMALQLTSTLPLIAPARIQVSSEQVLENISRNSKRSPQAEPWARTPPDVLGGYRSRRRRSYRPAASIIASRRIQVDHGFTLIIPFRLPTSIPPSRRNSTSLPPGCRIPASSSLTVREAVESSRRSWAGGARAMVDRWIRQGQRTLRDDQPSPPCRHLSRPTGW
jgi:hypothetical protein